jgi:hypothetical protein
LDPRHQLTPKRSLRADLPEMTKRTTLLLLSLVVLPWSCRTAPESATDLEARIPDDAGVVTLVTLERIELDGKNSYQVSEDLESFTTGDHTIRPLLSWKDRYVQLGLDDGAVQWVAGIGIVASDPPRVLYTGLFERLESERRAVFRDGTVLVLAEGVSAPPKGSEALATIDPSNDLVISIKAQ